MVNVTYDSPVIDFGPLSFGLTELPAAPEVTFSLGDGTPAGGGVTNYGLSDVLSANVIFGDAIGMNLTTFAMEVDAGGVTTALSYAFAIADTSTAAMSVVLNFPFSVTGTDIASGEAFSYTYANSEVTITPVPEPTTLALGTLLGLVGVVSRLRRRREDNATTHSIGENDMLAHFPCPAHGPHSAHGTVMRIVFFTLVAFIVASRADAGITTLVDVTYDSPVVDFGPLSFGLSELPVEPNATFTLGEGTPTVEETILYGLGDVLSANLIFGDGVFSTLSAFEMEVSADDAFVLSLTYQFSPFNTATAAGLIVLNFPLFITGTDIASGEAFSYTYANSEEEITCVVPEPSTLAICLGLGLVGVFRRRHGQRPAAVSKVFR